MTTTSTLRRRLAAALLGAAALLLPAAAGAQTGNQTDNGFPLPIGGSGPIGGSYLGPGLRTENELFVRLADRVGFRDAQAGCAVRAAAGEFRDSAAAPCGERARLVYLLLGARDGDRTSSLASQLADAISRGAPPESRTGRAARRLADALTNLFRERPGGGCGGDDEAEDWYRALVAYNEFVTTAPDSVFAPPSDELLIVHDALQRVVTAALRESRDR